MTLKFSMILEAIDRASAPAKRVRASVGGMTKGVAGFAAQMRKARRDVLSGARSVEYYQRRAERARRVFRGRSLQLLGAGFRAAGRGAAAFGTKLVGVAARLKLVERAGKAAGRGLKWAGGKLLGAAKWGLAAGAAAGSFALFDMFKTAGKFEQFQIMLEGTEGSAAKAKKAMAWVQGFAEKTPYELDQVMEAFVALKAYGIDPMNGSLMALGDGAWGMSKDLMQAVEALADAMTGEFERLKEFGIRASKQGDKVVFTYRKNGKDIRREAKMTGEDIEKAITGIFSDRFGGGMARQAKTLFGIISNMKDLWSKFLLMVADAGIFDKVKAKLDEWRARLDVMAKDGRLKAWAEKTSKWLEKAFDKGVDFVENTDWQGVAADFERIAQAALRVADAVNAIAANWEKVSWASNHMALPLFTRTLLDGWNAYGNGGNASGRPAVQPKRPASSDPFRRGSPWLRKPGAGAPTRQPAQQVKVGGKTEIDVRLTGPLAASVRSNKSVNPAIGQAVFVGKSMGGPG